MTEATRESAGGASDLDVEKTETVPEPIGGASDPVAEKENAAETLEIRVVWKSTGMPVVGAAVELRPTGSDRAVIGGNTGESGEITLAYSTKENGIELTVDHEHAAHRSIDVTLPVAAPLEVEVEEQGLLRGVVRDSVTKAPIPGAVVRINPDREFVADDEGAYVVNGFAPGKLGLTASAEGYADVPATLNVDTGDSQYKDFLLDPAVEIVVEVVDGTEVPIPDAKVMPSSYGGHGGFGLGGVDETDLEGRAILRRVSRLSPPNLMISKHGYKSTIVWRQFKLPGLDPKT